MRLGFVIEGISNMKILGDFFARADTLDITPIVFIPVWQKVKPYDVVTGKQMVGAFASLDRQHLHAYADGELAATVHETGVDSLLLLNPYRNFAEEEVQIAGRGTRVYGMDYFANSVYVAASGDDPERMQRSLNALTERIVASDWWRGLEFEVQPEHRKWASKFVSLGSPLIDVFDEIDSQQACSSLGLRPDKPVVSVFTPNIRNHQAYLFYGLGTRFTLRRLAHILRDYCDRRGYQLVVKSREKQWDAQPFLAVADKIIYDLPNQLHPSTSALLLKTSCLALHFGSMMVLEAAGAGVPSIAFSPEAVDKLHRYMRPGPRKIILETVLSGQSRSLFNFNAVSKSLPVGVKGQEFATVADDMLDSVGDDKSDYNAFNSTFSGWQEGGSASERILGYINNFEASDKYEQPAKLDVAEKISVS